MHLFGRAIYDERIDIKRKNSFALVLNSSRHFETDEIVDAYLTIHFTNGKKVEITIDEEGYYSTIVKNFATETRHGGWLNYKIEFSGKQAGKSSHQFEGEVWIPLPAAGFGVVSDIDDILLEQV